MKPASHFYLSLSPKVIHFHRYVLHVIIHCVLNAVVKKKLFTILLVKCPSIISSIPKEHFCWKSSGQNGITPLNVDTGLNPRRHVVFIEIQPNAYSKYLSWTAGVTLIFFWVVSFCIFEFARTVWKYISTKIYHPKIKSWREDINKQCPNS